MVEIDENALIDAQEARMLKYYTKMQKNDDHLYNRAENQKFKQVLKSEIYEEKM